MALSSGATLCIGTRDVLQPGPRLHSFLRDSEATIVILPPSALGALPPEPLPALETLAVGGEACPMSVVHKWAGKCRLLNIYGSTETFALTVDLINGSSKPISVGSPIGETHAHLLTEDATQLSVGASSELLIAGPGVARGYSNQPRLTASKFTPDPCGERPGGRLYRTGDLARYLEDGRLQLLGRMDRQVSIRGVRIEPEEIEMLLGQHPSIRQAIVVQRDDVPHDTHLIAYIVPTATGLLRNGSCGDSWRRSCPGPWSPISFIEWMPYR